MGEIEADRLEGLAALLGHRLKRDGEAVRLGAGRCRMQKLDPEAGEGAGAGAFDADAFSLFQRDEELIAEGGSLGTAEKRRQGYGNDHGSSTCDGLPNAVTELVKISLSDWPAQKDCDRFGACGACAAARPSRALPIPWNAVKVPFRTGCC